MGRRWARRGAIAAGLSVAVHLVLLAGMPLGSPGSRVERPREVAEVTVVHVPVPVTTTEPRPPALVPPRQIEPLARTQQDLLAPVPWNAVSDELPPPPAPLLLPAWLSSPAP